MKNIAAKMPIPASGLMLALAASGNLIMPYGAIYKNAFGAASSVILLFLIVKISMHPGVVFENLKNPVVASIAPTFPMGIMILSTYTVHATPSISLCIWILGLLIHFSLLLYFSKSFIFNFKIEQILPSYFVVYVGFIVGSVTAPPYGLYNIGQVLFWFGLAFYLTLLPLVIYRVGYVKGIPEPVLPANAIFAAPASLCLAGYMSSFQDKSIIMVGFLTILSLLMTFSVLLCLPQMLKVKFHPSYSAFTFPFVISAIAMKKTSAFLQSNGWALSHLNYIVVFEEILSIVIVLYVLVQYIKFLLLE